MNWLEGFRRLKILSQIAVLLALSFFSYEYWAEKPFFTKKLVYEEASFLSEEDKKSDEAYRKSLEKIGLKQKQINPTHLKISTVYKGPYREYDFPLNTPDLHIVKFLKKTHAAEFGQVFWSWLASCLLSVILIEASFRVVVWILQGFGKPK
jgi:hypothetical protein